MRLFKLFLFLVFMAAAVSANAQETGTAVLLEPANPALDTLRYRYIQVYFTPIKMTDPNTLIMNIMTGNAKGEKKDFGYKIVDEQGKDIKFYLLAGGYNYLAERGWEFVTTVQVAYSGLGGVQNHYMFRQRVR